MSVDPVLLNANRSHGNAYSEHHRDETLELVEAKMNLLEKRPFIPEVMIYTTAFSITVNFAKPFPNPPNIKYGLHPPSICLVSTPSWFHVTYKLYT